MGPLNTTFNLVNSWNNAGIFKREILSRTTNLVVALPTEIAAIGQNAIQSVVYTGSAVLKTAVRTLSSISGSEAIKNFEAKLPGFRDLLKAISRIVAYAFGSLLTATFGVIHPAANFRMHCNLGLIHKLKDEVKVEEATQQGLTENETLNEASLQTEKLIETIEKEIAEGDIANSKVLMEEILKEDEIQDEGFEELKNAAQENHESTNQNALENNDTITAQDSQSDSATEVSQQNIKADVKVDEKEEIAAKMQEKTNNVATRFLNKELGENGYHYYESVGIIIPKTPIEKARDYISTTINTTWNKLPNIRDRMPSFRANNN